MNPKKALIIFVRKPELGKVKTRLAATVGAEVALVIYRKLLEHTHEITAMLTADRYVFYTDAVTENDLWSDGCFKAVQADGDLGSRMKAAFGFLFDKGYHHVCIVGSDCLELTTGIIANAFVSLEEKDVVIGPAKDGGYYLLGMKGSVKDVFDGVEWSTANVLQQTEKKLQQQQLTYTLLPILNDVDTEEDVPEHLLRAAGVRR